MIDTKYPTDAFEDAIEATAYMATALLSRGELLLPPRIREHIADGVVVVHLLRGEEDVAVCEATLTSESKLSGIDWPADVKPRTSLVVLCPRGGASHDIGVVLPELELPRLIVEREPIADDDVDAMLAELADEDENDNSGAPEPVSDEQLAAITGALGAFADAAQPYRELAYPGPAEYATPTTLRVVERDEQPTETIAAVDWPADEPAYVSEEDPAEQTAIVPAVGELDSLEVLDRDRDYRSRWRRALAWVRTNMTPVRAVYVAATGGSFVGSLVTWLVTR